MEINEALLAPFFSPKPELPTLGRLHRHPSAVPLTKEEIAAALAKSSPFSAPGPDGVPYLAWKRVNATNPNLLLDLLAPLVALGYHPTTLKHANGVVLSKPGKPSYDTPTSFRIIVLLKTISKILYRQAHFSGEASWPNPPKPIWLPPRPQHLGRSGHPHP